MLKLLQRKEAAPAVVADPSEAPPEHVMIQLRKLHKGFGTKQILKGLNLTVERGTSAVVLGGSGSGKSVLIRHVVGLLRPDQGEVWVDGERLDLMEGDALDRTRLKIGYLFQGGALFDSMTVEENLKFYLDRHTKLTKAEKQERIRQAVEDVNLGHTLPQYPAELSGGQKKRIGLARAVILEPDIILYDEPTTGLDPVSVRVVSELIVRLRDERGITSVAITHDILCAEIITDAAHFLYEGRFLASGTLDEVRNTDHPVLEEFFKGTDAYLF
ncbi:MAG: ATP-binding cassette domain-containing protein [Rhodothermales bacterium]|nr:ATP-binding cassette domain-containing protein [Rhodothermales bacterium]